MLKSRIPYRDPRVKLGNDIVGNSRISNLKFLEIASVALLPRNDAGNSRILYRDPPRGLGDDIVGNSRISKLKTLGILEFLS